MADSFFISYSSVDGRDFALKLAEELQAGPPSIAVWLDQRKLRPGEDWDEQIAEAIRTCKALLFVMSADSVRPDSVCKNEWVRALKYKKPVIPLLRDRGADPPFRLESRHYIDFTAAFDPATAQLRKHLAWLDTPAGQLQALRHRLADAERDLPRAVAEQRPRIEEDIAELRRQIAQQQKVIDDPQAAEQRVQRSIETGMEIERKPAQPVGGAASVKFINPPPLIAPTWFQNRHLETRQIGEFLRDESLRLMTVVGRGGVGKSAMVCRLLRSLEGGKLPDDGGPMAVDGIVYLSAARSFHRPSLPDLYAGLAKLLPDETARRLDAVYRNPHGTARATMEALVRVFPAGRTVVLLDNFEDMLDVESGQIKDAELDEALCALLDLPPHGIKVIVTTRVPPAALALRQPGLQRRLDLDSGLQHPYAEAVLRAMDVDGKVGLRDAPDALLAEARERTLGYPRALEHLFGILSADRDASLQEVLEDTKRFLPEQVVTVLVGEAFSRLDPNAQRVMQALATYRYPVPAPAVDYLLQPHLSGGRSDRVLSRLFNMQFVRRDAGRYYLHQVDRDYALGRLPEGEAADRDAEPTPLTHSALRHRAAEWYRLTRKPREAWKTLSDLAAQLSEFDLRCEGEEHDTAARVLLEFDFDYLFLWGHYRLMASMHERLLGRVTDPELAGGSVGNFGSACYRMGQIGRAIELYEQALQIAVDHGDTGGEGTWIGNLSNCFSDRGEVARSIAYLERALAIRTTVGDRHGEANDLSGLGNRYATIGQLARAVDFCRQALAIDRELKNAEGEALVLDNLGDNHRLLGQFDDALHCHTEALAIALRIGYRYIEAMARSHLGNLHVAKGEWELALPCYVRAIEIADEIGSSQVSAGSRDCLALACLHLDRLAQARSTIDGALSINTSPSVLGSSTLRGIVALREADAAAAAMAFTAAAGEAERLVALTPEAFEALDWQGLALCGLALCGDPARLAAARTAFVAARAVTSAAGVTLDVLQRFDELARTDRAGLLAELRPVAAGRGG